VLLVYIEAMCFGLIEVNCFVTEENCLAGDMDYWLDDNYYLIGERNY